MKTPVSVYYQQKTVYPRLFFKIKYKITFLDCWYYIFSNYYLISAPCLGHFCAFYATCQVNQSSSQPYCACVDNCDNELVYPVCGSDFSTYKSECEMRLESCRRQRRIKALYESECKGRLWWNTFFFLVAMHFHVLAQKLYLVGL